MCNYFQNIYFYIRTVSQLCFFLHPGSLFTFGAGPSNSTIIDASISISTNSTVSSNDTRSSFENTNSGNAATTTFATTADVAPGTSKSTEEAQRSLNKSYPEEHTCVLCKIVVELLHHNAQSLCSFMGLLLFVFTSEL